MVTLTGRQPSEKYFKAPAAVERPEKKRTPVWNPSLDILGASLLDRTVTKLKSIGVDSPVVLQDKAAAAHFFPTESSKATGFLSQWEKAVTDAVSSGVEHLLFLRLGVYSDVDYTEVIESHIQSGAGMTQVHGPDAPLDIAVIDTTLLINSGGAYRSVLNSLVPRQARFNFHGYVNRLASVRDLFQLVQDGLYGRCQLRPVGKEVRQGVWMADGAEIHSTAMISAPAFIGWGSDIAAECTVASGSSIERDCKIDYASFIQESCILQDTYVGIALDVRRAVVGGQKIFALNRNVEVKVADRRLLSTTVKSNSWFTGLTSWMSREAQSAD